MTTYRTLEAPNVLQEQIGFLRKPINADTKNIDRDTRNKIADLLEMYKSNLELWEEQRSSQQQEINAKEALIQQLRTQNLLSSKVLEKMTQFVKTEQHAFYAYLAEQNPDGEPTKWSDYVQKLEDLDDSTLVDRLAALTIHSEH